MVKWESPLFSDLRNKFDDQVVFSSWKGNRYMRSHVDVLGGNEPEQQALRQHLGGAAKTWQWIESYTDPQDFWNKEASGTGLTGFNLFTQFHMQSDIWAEYDEENDEITVEWSHPIKEGRVDIFGLSAGSVQGEIESVHVSANPENEGKTVITEYEPGWNRYMICWSRGLWTPLEEFVKRGFAHYGRSEETGTSEPAILWF